jgi:hypothetical protein
VSVTVPRIVPRKVCALLVVALINRINPAKNSCANTKRPLRGFFMCISSLGLYVLPAALSSFKELARRIKQSNEDFVLASKMPGILHRPGSNCAALTRHGPVTVDVPRHAAQMGQSLPESHNDAKVFCEDFLRTGGGARLRKAGRVGFPRGKPEWGLRHMRQNCWN